MNHWEKSGHIRHSTDAPWRSCERLKGELQRHLNLARAADGVADNTETIRCVVELIGRRTLLRCFVIELVLRDLVAGDVEAGGVGQVVDVEGVFEGVALGEFGQLDDGGVGAALECLSVNPSRRARLSRACVSCGASDTGTACPLKLAFAGRGRSVSRSNTGAAPDNCRRQYAS